MVKTIIVLKGHVHGDTILAKWSQHGTAKMHNLEGMVMV